MAEGPWSSQATDQKVLGFNVSLALNAEFILLKDLYFAVQSICLLPRLIGQFRAVGNATDCGLCLLV